MRQISNQDSTNEGNYHTKESNSDGQDHEIDIATGDYSLAKPLSSNQKTN